MNGRWVVVLERESFATDIYRQGERQKDMWEKDIYIERDTWERDMERYNRERYVDRERYMKRDMW